MKITLEIPERHLETIMAMGCADKQCKFNAPVVGPDLGCMCLRSMDDYEEQAALYILGQVFRQGKEQGYETD